MEILNHSNKFTHEFFYYIDSQAIEIYYSDSYSDMEETRKKLVSKYKCKLNINFFIYGVKFKDSE